MFLWIHDAIHKFLFHLYGQKKRGSAINPTISNLTDCPANLGQALLKSDPYPG